jgi:hypothetical protein
MNIRAVACSLYNPTNHAFLFHSSTITNASEHVGYKKHTDRENVIYYTMQICEGEVTSDGKTGTSIASRGG